MKTHLLLLTLFLVTPLFAGERTSTVIPAPSSLKKFMPRLHEEKLREAKEGPVDLVMIGDSITHAWSRYPDAFKGTRLLNLGFPGDRTQNVLWRIQHVNQNRPVVFRFTVQSQKAFESWTDEYLAKQFGSRDISVEMNKTESRGGKTTQMTVPHLFITVITPEHVLFEASLSL